MIAFMLPVVSELFPEARFIHIVRDGRAVALSYAHKEFGKMQANEELYRACGVWCTFDELLEQMSRLWVAHIDEIDGVAERESWKEKGFYFECRYEDFCERPRELMAEIVGFMGFPNPRVSLEDEVRSMNHKFRQELSPEAIRSITAIMAETLTRKGYELHEEERSRPVLSSHGEEADSRGR
jgi:hypothetical protein